MNEPLIRHVALDDTGESRAYDIHIGAGLLPRAGKIIHDVLGARRLFVLVDDGVKDYVDALRASLSDAGHKSVDIRILPQGEGTKSWDALVSSVEWMLDAHVDRSCAVVAFGGGVVGDHAGFAAAITLRGLPYVQMPTTLLAQVDSSVGGKTGINTRQGKNLVGSFYQPSVVIADTDVLRTLPERHMHAGYAEIVKYAFIRDEAFFEWLEENAPKIFAHDAQALSWAIEKSCAMKGDVVTQDEREAGVRALLNFGHTFAHVLETACDYDRRVLHGEAVAIGMALAFRASEKLGLCGDNQTGQAIAHMKKYGLPTDIADIDGFPDMDASALVALMQNDKKARDGKITFILSRGIGDAFVCTDADMNVIEDVIAASLEGKSGK